MVYDLPQPTILLYKNDKLLHFIEFSSIIDYYVEENDVLKIKTDRNEYFTLYSTKTSPLSERHLSVLRVSLLRATTWRHDFTIDGNELASLEGNSIDCCFDYDNQDDQTIDLCNNSCKIETINLYDIKLYRLMENYLLIFSTNNDLITFNLKKDE